MKVKELFNELEDLIDEGKGDWDIIYRDAKYPFKDVQIDNVAKEPENDLIILE